MKILFSLFIFLLVNKAHSQNAISLGLMNNHVSHGISLGYQFPTQKKLTFEAGLRCMINSYSIIENKQQHAFYKTGYAFNFWQHWGAYQLLSYRILKIKKFSADVSTLFLWTTNGLRRKSHSANTHPWNTFYTRVQPGNIALESTLGLQVHYELNQNSKLTAGAGIGIYLNNFSNVGYEEHTNAIVYYSYSSKLFKNRGAWEMIGLDGLPSMYLKFSFKFPNQRPKRID